MMGAKLNKLIEKRYSPVIFSSKKVEPEKVELLIEAARWAASSRNEQPGRYIIGIKGDGHYDKIFQALISGNQLWAQHAPILMIAFVKETSSHNQAINPYARHDLGLALGNLIIQAMDMDLFVHPMGGFDPEQIKTAFQFPEHFTPSTALAVGYPGKADNFPEELQKMEKPIRTRRNLDELIYSGNWDKMG